MKKFEDMNTCELLGLAISISQKIAKCFDEKEIVVVKILLSNIIQQLCLFEIEHKNN